LDDGGYPATLSDFWRLTLWADEMTGVWLRCDVYVNGGL